MNSGNDTPSSRRKSSRFRLWRRLGIAALLLWFFYYPLERADLYRAVPEEAVAAAFLKNGVSEFESAMKAPFLKEAVAETFGCPPEEALLNLTPVTLTVRALTGSNTMLALVPDPHDPYAAPYPVGASYVGWKARILELLWRIAYVPGLGKLGITEQGTRFLDFGETEVLSIDIIDGVLVAAWHADPDAVRAVAGRVRAGKKTSLSPCFGKSTDGKPWKTIEKTHKIWLTPKAPIQSILCSENSSLQLSSFKKVPFEMFFETEESVVSALFGTNFSLPLLAQLPPFPAHSLRIPARTAGIITAFPLSLQNDILLQAFPAEQRKAAALLWFSKGDFLGTLPLLATPVTAASLAVSFTDEKISRSYLYSLKSQLPGEFRVRTEKDGDRLLLNLRSIELFGKPPRKNCFFLETEKTALLASSHLGSYEKQCAEKVQKDEQTLADLYAAWQRDETLIAAMKLDFAFLAQEFQKLESVCRLIQQLGIEIPSYSDENVPQILRALGGLGNSEWSLQERENSLRLNIRFTGEETLP